jgi:transcriptional regulator with XRE-family HTH domain
VIDMPTNPDDVIGRMGRVIAVRRIELGMNQSEFAQRSGINRCYLNGVESGNRNLSVRTIQTLANALDIPAWKIYYMAEMAKKSIRKIDA